MSDSARRMAYVLWGLIVADVVLAVLIANWQIPAQALALGLIVVGSLIMTLTLATIGLVVVYRQVLSRWSTWFILVLLFLIGAMAVQGYLRIPDTRVSLLQTLLFPMAGVALISAIFIQLLRHDIGAPLVAIISVVCVWGLLLVWQVQGNYIEAVLQYLQTGKPVIVWWVNLFLSLCLCLIPLAVLSFAWHTAVLLLREQQFARRTQQVDPDT
jgi:hypothetical protein